MHIAIKMVKYSRRFTAASPVRVCQGRGPAPLSFEREGVQQLISRSTLVKGCGTCQPTPHNRPYMGRPS
jgi:hypothetical protein